MVAETLLKPIGAIVFLMIPVLLVLSLVLRVRNRRHEAMLIRRWCDREGLAISRMQPINISLFAAMMFWAGGWLLWWVAYQRGWRLTIHDSDGGVKDLVLRVHRHAQVEETWD